MNRPETRNAISRQLLSELSHEIESLHELSAPASSTTAATATGTPQNDPSTQPRALIITSELDSAFCAGADLKERLTFTAAQTTAFLTELRRTFARLAALRIPTISCVAGSAFGGGLELALCTHLRVFAESAVVALPETRLAIIPGAGGTFRLPGVIGEQRARDLILTGRRVGGREAMIMGLCDRLVEEGEDVRGQRDGKGGVMRQAVEKVAIETAYGICEGGPVAIRAAIEAVGDWRLGQEAENKAYAQVLGTEDRIEALKAFGEKRKPVYKGR